MPLAVDTNILARALVDDDTDQSRTARQFLLRNDIFVPNTVLLETEWVLRSNLGLPRAAVSSLLMSLLSTKGVSFENRARVAGAVLAHKDGLDFADALHLLTAAECDAMITFDKAFIRGAAKVAGTVPVRTPRVQMGR